MSSYDNVYSNDNIQNLLAAHKPRPWKTETALDLTGYSKPESTSSNQNSSQQADQN